MTSGLGPLFPRADSTLPPVGRRQRHANQSATIVGAPFDSAAVVKLVRQEVCSADLVSWLNTHDDVPLVSSALVEVEVPRALRRSAPQALIGVPAAVGRLFRLEIDNTIRATAAAFAEPTLRSLDAIHLATAQVLTNESGTALVAFVTYDRRLLECAKAAGLPTASPGQN